MKKNVLAKTAKKLKQVEPEKIEAFIKSFNENRNLDLSVKVFEGIQLGKLLEMWREIVVDIVDVEFQIRRVKNSLLLLKSVYEIWRGDNKTVWKST